MNIKFVRSVIDLNTSLSPDQIHREIVKGVSISPTLTKVWKGRFCGLVNEKGEIVVDIKYSWIDNFINDYALMIGGVDPYWGFINKKGEIVVDPDYYVWISNFKQDGTATVKRVGYGIINGLGEILIPVDLEKDEGQIIIEKIKCDYVKTNNKENFLNDLKADYPSTFQALREWLKNFN